MAVPLKKRSSSDSIAKFVPKYAILCRHPAVPNRFKSLIKLLLRS